LILFGAIPKPVQAPAAVVFDEVTKDRFQNRHLIKNLEHLRIILIFLLFALGVNILRYQ
jgi:hypothetical protein